MIDELDRQMLGLLESLGGVGMQAYYTSKIKSGRIVSETDRRLIAEVMSRWPPGTRVHEFAAGVGQVAHVLAAYGYSVSMSETDGGRSAAAKWLRGGLGTSVAILEAKWQSLDLRGIPLLISNNAVSSSTDWERDKPLFEKHIQENNGEVIMNPVLYGKKDTERVIDTHLKTKEVGMGLWRWFQ